MRIPAWTPEEEQRLKELYNANVPEEAIMVILGKNLQAYRAKCRALGLGYRSFDRPRYPAPTVRRIKKGQNTLPKLASEM